MRPHITKKRISNLPSRDRLSAIILWSTRAGSDIDAVFSSPHPMPLNYLQHASAGRRGIYTMRVLVLNSKTLRKLREKVVEFLEKTIDRT